MCTVFLFFFFWLEPTNAYKVPGDASKGKRSVNGRQVGSQFRWCARRSVPFCVRSFALTSVGCCLFVVVFFFFCLVALVFICMISVMLLLLFFFSSSPACLTVANHHHHQHRATTHRSNKVFGRGTPNTHTQTHQTPSRNKKKIIATNEQNKAVA